MQIAARCRFYLLEATHGGQFRATLSLQPSANARLYEAALALGEGVYRRDVGAFFKSFRGTLSHRLVTDRIWMKGLTGGDRPGMVSAIIHDDRRVLALARADEDDCIIGFVASLNEAMIAGRLQ